MGEEETGRCGGEASVGGKEVPVHSNPQKEGLPRWFFNMPCETTIMLGFKLT